MEKKLLQAADLVFVTAQGLYDTKKDFCREIHFLPNAADVPHFMKADDPTTPLAPEFAEMPKPVFGFIGAIKEWIDLPLIASVADTYPQGSVAMVGPVGAGLDTSILTSRPNVHFLGHRSREVLPTYLKGFDVCLNPFRTSELTSTVSPLKFYEYLASGRPIASVEMPEIMDFADVIEFGSGKEGFVGAVARALDDTPQKKKTRLSRALENSWESRVRLIMERIDNLLG
jgi:glycosyltransferase involved in cell wall biosynthesis